MGKTTLHERVSSVLPALQAQVRETEAARRIPDASIAALRDAGVFRALVPSRHGGDEVSPASLFEALIEIGTACSATCWVASLMAIHGFVLARFDPQAQDEVWANGPDVLAASGVAPSGTGFATEGGVRVCGRWSYASGVDHCSWAILNTLVRDEGAPDAKPTSQFVLVPASDFHIDDDWHVAGLRGTGSKTLVLEDVLVPPHRIVSGLALTAGKTRGVAANSALFQISFPALFPLTFSAPAIGTALAMIEHYRAYTGSRKAAYTGAAYKGKPAAWMRLAESTADVDAARTLLARDLTALEAEALQHEPATTERARYDAAYIVSLCARAVDRVYEASGGRALYETSPLQRGFRDMHAITQHAATNLDDAGERYGQFLLG